MDRHSLFSFMPFFCVCVTFISINKWKKILLKDGFLLEILVVHVWCVSETRAQMESSGCDCFPCDSKAPVRSKEHESLWN